jgi:methylmalonyl-CoA/ethylmalonyl-CoA epimerase
MISRIDHVSIAVKDQEKAARFFSEVLGAIPGAHAADAEKRFFWQIFSLGDLTRLEIISPTGKGSFLDGFLKSRESGVHHMTLQTPDIQKAMDHLNSHGVPFFGFDDHAHDYWKEIFIHPRDAFGVLIQIAEFRADDWLADEVKMAASKRWQVEKTESGATLTFAHPGGGKVSIEMNRQEVMQLMKALESTLK